MSRRIAAGLIACLMCIMSAFLLPGRANAVSSGAEPCTLTIVFKNDDTPIDGVVFRVYHVAVQTEQGAFRWTEAFEDCQASPEALETWDSEDLRALAVTLDSYATTHSVMADAGGMTNSDGILALTELKQGAYLLAGYPVTIDGTTYVPQPILIRLPAWSDGAWSSDITVAPKYTSYEENEPGSIYVRKIWRNDSAQERPDTIIVQMFKDRELFDEVELSEENGWKYEWTGLEPGHIWQVNEKEIPEGYTVEIEQSGLSFIITNTGEEPPPEEPPDEPELPQTGQVWWPVPVLICAGIMMFAVGLLLKRSEDAEEPRK